jgi:hypothetical protein
MTPEEVQALIDAALQSNEANLNSWSRISLSGIVWPILLQSANAIYESNSWMQAVHTGQATSGDEFIEPILNSDEITSNIYKINDMIFRALVDIDILTAGSPGAVEARDCCGFGFGLLELPIPANPDNPLVMMLCSNNGTGSPNRRYKLFTSRGTTLPGSTAIIDTGINFTPPQTIGVDCIKLLWEPRIPKATMYLNGAIIATQTNPAVLPVDVTGGFHSLGCMFASAQDVAANNHASSFRIYAPEILIKDIGRVGA